MRSKEELVDTINSAEQAKAMVEHPLFIASMDTLRELTIDKFEGLEFGQVERMQECNVRLNLIEEFKANLTSIIMNGDAAYQALEDIQTHQQAIENGR
ncbi:MAG: hypothetical protein ACPGUE_12040 [Marinomonas sp.]